MYVFTLSGKEPNETAIVKRNINQNNFSKGHPNFYFDLGPTQTLAGPGYLLFELKRCLSNTCKLVMPIKLLYTHNPLQNELLATLRNFPDLVKGQRLANPPTIFH